MGIRDEILKIEIAEGFQHALDNNFRQLRENAQREWEHRFAGNDPSAACVTVRISVAPQGRLSSVPCAGVVAQVVAPPSGKARPLLV
jgi:hypothetical protein